MAAQAAARWAISPASGLRRRRSSTPSASFIGKDVAVVRETVAELGGDLGALDGMVNAGLKQ